MANPVKMAKRIPLIKFPNRKGGQNQGQGAAIKAVKAIKQRWQGAPLYLSSPHISTCHSVPWSSGGGKSEPMPSLPAGTATSQPHRTPVSQEEIDFNLLGGAGP